MITVWFDKDAYVKTESAQTAYDRIAALDNIITTLIAAYALRGDNKGRKEYKLDDGQTKVEVVYDSFEAITERIRNLEALKNMYANRVNGRMSRSVGQQSFPRTRY